MRLFETNGSSEAIDSPTHLVILRLECLAHCKIYNLMMELTTVRARERVCTYGIPVAIGLQKHEGRGH